MGNVGTANGQTQVGWRLMGRTLVPLNQAIGGGLMHDCSTWDDL